MRVLPAAILLLQLVSLVPATRATCKLNEGTNVSEISLCGPEDWVEVAFPGECTLHRFRVYAGKYEDGVAVRKFIAPAPANGATIGTPGNTITYALSKGFIVFSSDPAERLPVDLEYGDIDWVAICRPASEHDNRLPWDEQHDFDLCSGFANVGVPVMPCSSLFRPSWGKPGALPPWSDDPVKRHARAVKGGVCELEATQERPNTECISSPTPELCDVSDVLINEVDGDAINHGVDWVELVHTGGNSGACELRGCKLLTFMGSVACSEVPRTKTLMDLNLTPGSHTLLFSNQDFVSQADSIPAYQHTPMTVALCCAQGFKASWDGGQPQEGACTSLSGISSTVDSTHAPISWGRPFDAASAWSCALQPTKLKSNGGCVCPDIWNQQPPSLSAALQTLPPGPSPPASQPPSPLQAPLTPPKQPATTSSAQKPNIVLILADDMEASWKLDPLSFMPNLRTRIAEQGVAFVNHIATNPQCGPSRAALLTGRWSHSNGYMRNNDQPSYDAYAQIQNDTVGQWLSEVGYYTAFLGKYVNGFEKAVPAGWTHFGGLLNPYVFYDNRQWNVTQGQAAADTISHTGRHQAEFLGEQAVQHMQAARSASKPFFVHLTPAMTHWGPCYTQGDGIAFDDPLHEAALPCPEGVCNFRVSPCPSDRNKHAFNGVSMPRVPSWKRTATGPRPPQEERNKRYEPVTAWAAARQDMGWRNKSASAIDLDDMLGVVLDGLDSLGLRDETYVFFTSDNGYHLGEHQGDFGKGAPYLTDTSVPFFARGPGLRPNSQLAHASTHIDITATIAQLAGAVPANGRLEGKSLVTAPGAEPEEAEEWRSYQFAENGRFWKIRYPGNKTEMHWYCDGDGAAGIAQVGTPNVFDLATDEWELHNLVGPGGTAEGALMLASALPLAAGMAACRGSACNDAPRLAPDPVEPLPCYRITPARA